MGNKNSQTRKDSDETYWKSDCGSTPTWSSEIWTPNLTVLMSSDSSHVVVRYRTNSNEVIEISARETSHEVAKELIEFGKSLHSFSADESADVKSNLPTLTLFLNDSSGSGHPGGFVQVSLGHQVNVEMENYTDDTRMKVDNVISNNSEKMRNGTMVGDVKSRMAEEGVILKKIAPAKGRRLAEDLTNPVSGTSEKSIEHASPVRKLSTLGSPKYGGSILRSQKTASGQSTSPKTRNKTKHDFNYGLTVSDIRELRKKNVNPAESPTKREECVSPETRLNALDTPDENAYNGHSGSESTPPTEIEVSDSEITLRGCASKLQDFERTAKTKEKTRESNKLKTTSAKLVLARPDRRSLLPQTTLVSEMKKDEISDEQKITRDNDDTDPRQQAWLAFVRTLKHHDQENGSETSLSDFSDYETERHLSVSSSDHEQ